MRMFYSKAALLALLPAAMGSLHAAESLVQTNVVEDDHAYETVTHLDQQREGYVIEEGWKITGDLRVGLLTYDYSNDPANPDPNINNGHMDSNGIYVVPKLSITSPNYNGFTFTITGAGATDFGINDPLYESRNFVFDPTEKKSFVILQEAYVSYETEDGAHAFLVGAKETVTPMVDADDWYMLADSFQGAYYRNKSFENIMFAGGYFYKMIGVWDSGANGTQWHTMSDASFVDSGYKKIAGDEGIWTGVFQYNDGTHNLQIWDYYMQDYYNTFFAQYDYNGEFKAYGFSYDAGLQFIDFQGVGGLEDYYKNVLGGRAIDYSIYSLRLNTKHDNGFDVALGASFYTDGDGTGDTLGAFGGYPYFANGMIFHFFEAGSLRNTNSYKVQLGYNFEKQGAKGLWIGARYTMFDLDPQYSKNGYGDPQERMNLYGIRVSYNAEGGFYFTGTYEKVDLDAEPSTYSVRLIGGYKF
ncbi:MAG: OprD family porin [Sulfurovum sp.]|nr:OprD family porin [Sulfurovum sp.]